MDEPIVAWLPDMDAVPLTELFTTTDPAILAAIDRIVEQALDADPDGGCGC